MQVLSVKKKSADLDFSDIGENQHKIEFENYAPSLITNS
jgi:hypothetical protein